MNLDSFLILCSVVTTNGRDLLAGRVSWLSVFFCFYLLCSKVHTWYRPHFPTAADVPNGNGPPRVLGGDNRTERPSPESSVNLGPTGIVAYHERLVLPKEGGDGDGDGVGEGEG